MGSKTATYALPYTTGGDKVTDGDNALQDLATKADGALTDVIAVKVTPATGIDPANFVFDANIVFKRLLLITGYVRPTANMTGGTTTYLANILSDELLMPASDDVEVSLLRSDSAEIVQRALIVQKGNFMTLAAGSKLTANAFYCFSATIALVKYTM